MDNKFSVLLDSLKTSIIQVEFTEMRSNVAEFRGRSAFVLYCVVSGCLCVLSVERMISRFPTRQWTKRAKVPKVFAMS